jgi:hypothetical protein
MRNGVIASLLVVALLAGAGAGYFIGVSSQRPIQSSSSSTTATTSTTMPSDVCVTAPAGSFLYIRGTLDDRKTPVTNASIDAELWEACIRSDGTHEDVNIAILIQGMKPNASGVAKLDAAYLSYFKVTVHYAGHDYYFEADVHNATPTRPTCANLGVPSGSLSVSSC